VLVSLLTPGVVRAEGGDDEAFLERGIELRKEHRDAEALEQFRQAEALNPTPKVKAQIALAEHALGRWVDAERDLVAALARPDDPWIASRATVLRSSLEFIRKHLGTLIVRANVDGAELWINGERRGELPKDRIRVVAGPLHLQVSAKGYAPVYRTMDLEPETTLTADVVLVADPEGTDRPVIATPTPESERPRLRRTAAWGALIGSGVFLGGAIGAQLFRNEQASLYNDDAVCRVPGRSRDETCGIYRDRGETAQSLANLGYIASGSLAVAAAILFFADRSASKVHTGERRIFIVPGLAGAELVGKW
jgi:hypothetical protein